MARPHRLDRVVCQIEIAGNVMIRDNLRLAPFIKRKEEKLQLHADLEEKAHFPGLFQHLRQQIARIADERIAVLRRD